MMKALGNHWLVLQTAVMQTTIAQMAKGRQRNKDKVLLLDRHAMYAISLITGGCVPGPNAASVGNMDIGSRAVVLAYECWTCKGKVLNGAGGK